MPASAWWSVLGILVGVALMVGATTARAAEEKADVVVYGGTPAGIAAAVAAGREGVSVLLLEPTRHVGGLHTSGLTTAEWAQNWDTFSGLLEEFFRRLGKAYGTKDARYQWESKVAEGVYQDMLRDAKVAVRFEELIDRAEKRAGRLASIAMTDGSVFRGRVFIDASYEGDLLARAGVSYALGREGRDQYGEDLAGIRLDPKPVSASPYDADGRLLPDVALTLDKLGPAGAADRKVMVYNFRVIVTDRADNRLPLPRPANYDPTRYQMLAGVLRENPGIKLEDLLYLPGRPNGKFELNNRQDATVSLGLLGAQHDWPEASHQERRVIWQAYKDYTLGYLYYLAHEPTVPQAVRDRMAQFGLPKDEFEDNDHWPYYVYVREARRMVGAYVMVQRDNQAERDKSDTVAIGSHWLDCHHVQRVAISKTEFKNEGRFWVDQGKRPYEIPYRSLVPKREECDNLLVPVCLSASHVAFSSVRVEETWMMLGQAAGAAAAMAARRSTAVQDVDVPSLQGRLRVTGLRIDRAVLEPDAKRPPTEAGQELPWPSMTEGGPAPGKFVKQVAPEFRGMGVYHALYLPVNWKPGGAYPVIVEYAPNRWEELTGKVEDCRLGFHLSGGKDFIWIVMPYVDPVKKENVLWWWGDEKATIEYGLATLRRVCETYGGDPNAVLFAGFSRGAIAASYLGLRDESAADVWLAFLPHSHVDGGRFTPDGARERLARTRGRATFITYGGDDDGKNESPKGAAILRELGFPMVERELAGLKHTDRFLEKDSPIRREMRQWISEVLKSRPGTHAVRGRVVDANDKGIAGARVQCGTWHWTVTGADGGYVIPSLVPGRRRLSVTKNGFAFAPTERDVVVEDRDVDAEPFTGTPVR